MVYLLKLQKWDLLNTCSCLAFGVPGKSTSWNTLAWNTLSNKECLVNHERYSSPPLIRPHSGNGKYGLIREVASREGFIRYNYARFVL